MALTIPNVFVANTAAAAADVNENFDAIETYVNASLATLTDLTDLPKGFIVQSKLTASSATFTTITDITGFTVTFTAEANRRYKLSLHCDVSSTVAGDFVRAYITNDADTIQVRAGSEVAAANEPQTVNAFAVVSLSAGAATFKVRGERVSGTGNCSLVAGGTAPMTLLVEDIGPT